MGQHPTLSEDRGSAHSLNKLRVLFPKKQVTAVMQAFSVTWGYLRELKFIIITTDNGPKVQDYKEAM